MQKSVLPFRYFARPTNLRTGTGAGWQNSSVAHGLNSAERACVLLYATDNGPLTTDSDAAILSA